MKITKTVYLAGKIAGDESYRSKFKAAANMLGLAGFAVINPAMLPPEGFAYAAYMRMGAAMLEECEAVCFLPDWNESEGAIAEMKLARELGIEIFYYDDWLKELKQIKSGMRKAFKEAGANGLQYAT